MARVIGKMAKLLRMPPGEIAGRLGLAAGAAQDRAAVALKARTDPERAFARHVRAPAGTSGRAAAEALLTERRRAGRFLVAPEGAEADRRAFGTDFPAWGEAARARGEDVLAGRVPLLNRDFTFETPFPWHADPVSGREWPRAPYWQVDIFGGDTGHGDVKYVWELNRHQFLMDLAKAYRVTGEARYADACVAHLEDWIAQNPYRRGVNWASALELAVRALAWTWACHLLLDSPAWTAEVHRRFLGSLAQHGRQIERHLSLYFSPYNHLVGEAAAIYVLGAVFPELKAASRWRRRGWGLLAGTLDGQFHPDGGTVEQATSYHFFTLGFYLQAVCLRDLHGEPVPEAVRGRLERAVAHAMWMMRPDGTWDLRGDNDEALSIGLTHPPRHDFREFLAVGAALFGRGDLKERSGGFSELAWWLTGPEGRARFEALEAAPPARRSVVLVPSGYAVQRSGWGREAHQLVLDAGEIAHGVHPDATPSAAHGHADALSVTVAAWGRPAVVDPGFFTYNGDEAWHRYQRETAAHSTVVVDDTPQARYAGRLKWSHAAPARLDTALATPAFDLAVASHDGYLGLPEGVRHRRRVVFLRPDYWLIRDELEGAGSHRVARYFHLAPGAAAAEAGAPAVRLDLDGGGLLVRGVEAEGVAVTLTAGGAGPEGGWISPGYGLKAPAPVACLGSVLTAPGAVHTVLLPYRGAAPPPLAVEAPAAEKETGDGFALALPTGTDHFLFAAGDGAAPRLGEWGTDGRAAVARVDAGGNVTGGLVVEGSVLERDGTPVLGCDRPVAWAALDGRPERPVVTVSEACEVTAPAGARVMVAGEPAP